LKSRIHVFGPEKIDFDKKFNELYRMANGQIRDVDKATSIAA